MRTVLAVLTSIAFPLASACGDDAPANADGAQDAGAPDGSALDYEVATDLDLHTPLDQLEPPEARSVCLQEFARVDLCDEVILAALDTESCAALVAECRELDPGDARSACRDADYAMLRCSATAGEYLNCLQAWSDALSCANVRAQDTRPPACGPLFEQCPDMPRLLGYLDTGEPPDTVDWAPDLSIPVDQAVPNDLDMAAPAQGFQLRSGGMMIEPHSDVEYFEILEVPGDPDQAQYIERIELQMTLHSHHMSVNAVRVDSAAHDALVVGSRGPGLASQVLSLNDEGTMGYDSLVERLTSSQAPYKDEVYPSGVGRVLYGGQKILLDYHYLNLTDAPVPAAHRINFHTTDAEVRVIRQFQWTDIGISIPPNSSGTVEGECTFTKDVIVASLMRHTHSRGTNFEVSFLGGDSDGALVYRSADWELDTDHRFEGAGRPMRAGEGFRFVCDYENPDSFTVGFGEKATDEMCILFGLFYTEDGAPTAPEDCLLL